MSCVYSYKQCDTKSVFYLRPPKGSGRSVSNSDLSLVHKLFT